MAAKSLKKKQSVPEWQGGVAGASTGTTLLVLVNLLPEGSLIKPVLTYLSPAITVVTGLTWAYAISTLKNWLDDRRLKAESEKAKELIRRIESDPRVSEEHKKAIRQKSEELDLILIEIHTDRIETIRTIDKA